VISRGWVDPQNRTSLYVDDPVTPGEFYQISWTLDPKDYTITAGSRLALVVLSTDPGYSVRPLDGAELAVKPGLSTLTLPLVGGDLAFKANLTGALTSIEAIPSATQIAAGDAVTVRVTGTGATGATFGDLTDDATLTSSNAGDVIVGNAIQATIAGTRTVTVAVSGVTTTFQLVVAAAPTPAGAVLTPTFSESALAGQSLLPVTSGGSLTVTGASTLDAYGNTVPLSGVVVASSNPSDVIKGGTVTFGTVGLRTLSVTAAGLTRTYPVYVGAKEAPAPTAPATTPPPTIPPTTAPTTPAPAPSQPGVGPEAVKEQAPTTAVVTGVLPTKVLTTAKRGTLEVQVKAPAGKSVYKDVVSVIAGNKTVHRRLNTDGKATVTLPRLAPGSHRVLLLYTGSDGAAQSQTVGWVTVTKAVPKTVKVTAAKKATTTAGAKVTVQVKHPDVTAPTGKVLVKVTKSGKTVVTKTVQLKAKDKGKTTITLPKITTAGTYSLKATYTGNTILAKKTSKATKLTIN
jgi:hypothetical protein